MRDWAKFEHVYRLREEGCTYREIGERLGVSRERARQMWFSYCQENNFPMNKQYNPSNAVRMRAYHRKRKGRELDA